MTEDEMVGWHHRLDGHEFEQAPGVGRGEGRLVCRNPWSHKESKTFGKGQYREENIPLVHSLPNRGSALRALPSGSFLAVTSLNL